MTFGGAALRYSKKILRWGLSLLMVLFVSLSLISFGGLIQISDTWVLVHDNDPHTETDLSFLIEIENLDDLGSELDPDGDGRIPLNGGTLILTPGFQAKVEQTAPFVNRTVSWSLPSEFCPPSKTLHSHLSVKAYKDFGHLRIIPDDGVIKNTAYQAFT